jgi:anti-sigma B factor antagonist
MPEFQNCPGSSVAQGYKNLLIFMIPKPISERLSLRMDFMQNICQTCPPAGPAAALAILPKESKLKLSLETRKHDDVAVVYCQGRIVYREEAAALSRLVADLLQHSTKVVLDLSDVSSIDSAGIGELVLLHTLAQSKHARLSCASPRTFVRDLFQLTRLDSFFEIYSSVDEAISAFAPAEVCADC